MNVFIKYTDRPCPTEDGWKVGQLSRNALIQEIGNDEIVDQGIEYALEQHWIIEKALGTDMYCPTETGFTECW